jgi:medium-chain acyl-[acyl-carrier-protein] hydrolase
MIYHANYSNIPHYSSSLYQKKHIEFFHIDFCHVDMTGKTTVPSLINFLQETAWQHACRLNMGYHEMVKQNIAFVINKMLIKTRRLPEWNEMVSVETWLHPPEHVHALREFTVRDNNRNLIAAASISYIAIDMLTRKLGKIPNNVENCCTGEVFLDEKPSRILPVKTHTFEAVHIVKPSDVDMNQHVNNSRYVQWIFDNMPEKWQTETKPVCLNINFLHEASLGSEVCIYFTEKGKELFASGINKKDNKCIFSANIKFK